jgi:hypothetical protein
VAVADSWTIYAILGVLVALILWQVWSQRKLKTQQAQDLRASLLIWVVIAAAMVAWLFISH